MDWIKKAQSYYLDRLLRAFEAKKDNKCNQWSDISKWNLFTYYVALKQGQVCWRDLPKSILTQMDLTTRKESSIDLVSPDLKYATKIHCSEDTPLTQDSIATFVQWSFAVLPKAEKQIVTLDETVISTTVQNVLMPRLKIKHASYSWEQLKEDVEKWNKGEEVLIS